MVELHELYIEIIKRFHQSNDNKDFDISMDQSDMEFSQGDNVICSVS